MSNASKLVGTFVGILVLIVAIAAAAPLLAGSAPSENRTAINASTFEPSANLVETPAENGTLSVAATNESKVVVIDRAHQNDFGSSDVQPMIDALVEAGHEVRYLGSTGQQVQRPNLNATLRGADAFVTIAPRRGFRDGEVAGLTNFTERGGRVLLLAEPSSAQISGGLLSGVSVTEVSTQLTTVSSEYGMAVGTGYLYNMYENANNFQNVYATPTGNDTLTDGVDRVTFDRATQVTVNDSTATSTLAAIDRTHLSSTRANSTFAVAARSGNVTLVGDSDFISPTYVRDSDNEVLLSNTLTFLVSGNKTELPSPTQRGAGSGAGFGGAGGQYPQAPSGGSTGGSGGA